MKRDEVIDYIQQVHFGYLATVGADNSPRVRPVAIHNVYDNNLYFFTFLNTRKVKELENNPKVEVVWSKLKEQSQVRIQGMVAVEHGEAVKQRFQKDNPMVAKMLPEEAMHLFCLYRLQPEKVEIANGLVPYEVVDW